jgi:hypothetical protein
MPFRAVHCLIENVQSITLVLDHNPGHVGLVSRKGRNRENRTAGNEGQKELVKFSATEVNRARPR